MKLFGRLLQIAGLVLLPVAMILNLMNMLGTSGIGLNQMLILLVFGATAFVLGRYVEGYAKR